MGPSTVFSPQGRIKRICHDTLQFDAIYKKNREDAINTMKRALGEFKIEPIQTTIPTCRKILSHNLYVKGQIDTGFIERHIT